MRLAPVLFHSPPLLLSRLIQFVRWREQITANKRRLGPLEAPTYLFQFIIMNHMEVRINGDICCPPDEQNSAIFSC